MSLEAYKRVWAQADRRGTRKLVLLALAEYADPMGVCWPSIPTIAIMTGETPDWVGKLLDQAAAEGDIMRNPGRGRGNTTIYGIAVGLAPEERQRLAILIAHTTIRKGVRYIQIDGERIVYTPGAETSLFEKGVLQTPFSGQATEQDVEKPAIVVPVAPAQPQHHRPARRPAPEPEHIRWLRVEEGIVTAQDFAHLDAEALIEDYKARRAEGQPKGTIVKYWKQYPPTKEDHYRGRQNEKDQSGRSVNGSQGDTDRPARRPKPGDPEYYLNRS